MLNFAFIMISFQGSENYKFTSICGNKLFPVICNDIIAWNYMEYIILSSLGKTGHLSYKCNPICNVIH